MGLRMVGIAKVRESERTMFYLIKNIRALRKNLPRNRGSQYTGGKTANGGFGITQEELAEQYGYSVDVIKRAESLTKLPQEIQDLVQEGTFHLLPYSNFFRYNILIYGF
ncbi:hypothetical protein [Butyricicoccus porcorum]|uniref:ParB/Spo0J HTH domain-containing protein n=1 Tax=Butyricicoccus porcorum TaxID=1945634 RepID=A0A252F605_9FIRM|nr:hypothetical protein [Butyricicoccus porcorum]OUM21090.1 hypothetical protein CBW42_05770 [Butyricicoccus porcorum]